MKTILLLDDESVVMKLLLRVLRGYALIEATTAADAVRLFAHRDRQPDLLLADLNLPNSSGIEVALILRLEIPHLPVILTSGYPLGIWTERNCADLEALGSKSVVVLQKPSQPIILLNAVRQLIGAPTEIAGTA
jgi:CheY-like chemotaxis protein